MLNIQEAIRSGKPFRRKGWANDEIYVVYVEKDTALSLETDFSTSIELDVQDLLADDWYTREDGKTYVDPYPKGHTQLSPDTQRWE